MAGKKLRELMVKKELVCAPGAYSALTAKLIEEAGFNSVYMSGYCTAASTLALPDLGLLTMTEMAENAKRIADDWLTIYNHPLYLLETFVEKDRFKGTCYKAANWICVGQTKGTAKSGHDHVFHGSIKDVYLYPLGKDFRKKLTG